jgi:hypothetical protein
LGTKQLKFQLTELQLANLAMRLRPSGQKRQAARDGAVLGTMKLLRQMGLINKIDSWE